MNRATFCLILGWMCTLVRSTSLLRGRTTPKHSLANSQWVKLICGASNSDLPLIRNTCYIYSSAGVDCIDVSADSAVVLAAQEAVDASIRDGRRERDTMPYIMISVNDDEDPHFRKARFDPGKCPADCPRPCEKVCPASAIPPLASSGSLSSSNAKNGVLPERCYGCGRCVPICPLGLVKTESFLTDREVIHDLFEPKAGERRGVDAIEVHTHHGNREHFAKLWQDIGQTVLSNAKVIAVSFPDMGEDTVPYINSLLSTMRHVDERAYSAFQGKREKGGTGVHVWQTDGRPMSGDIGKGTAHASSEFAARMLRDLKTGSENTDAGAIDLRSGRHYLQLAGGTNAYSVITAESNGISTEEGFGGYAFGGYARKLLSKELLALEEAYPGALIEEPQHADIMDRCQLLASQLVDSVKDPTRKAPLK
jgi:Fe-S-cluster-containing hydrogenase component 2